MMPSDPEEHVAQMFHGLISDLQQADVAAFEERQRVERDQRAALRAEQPGCGLTAGELLKKLDGDPAADQRRVEEELAKIARDAQAAVTAKKQEQDDSSKATTHFPPPPKSG